MNNYLIELGIIHSLLILGYWLFLRRERQYAKMRGYLITATIVSLVIPLLKLPALFYNGNEAIHVIPHMPAYTFEAMSIAEADTSFWSWNLTIWGYAAISALFLLGFLKNLIALLILERKSRYEKFSGMYIRRINGVNGSFTFFNSIFLSEEIDNTQEEYKTILKHEQAHANLGHTYDLMFFELFRVCFWWLPSSWFIRSEIKKIHEYQADSFALKSCDSEKYSTILISSTLKINGLSLASSFHDGLIIKRLKAMKEQTKKLSPWKMGILGVLLALLFVVFACSEELEKDIQEIGTQSNAITFDQLPLEMRNKFITEHQEEMSFLKITIREGQKVSDVYDVLNIDPQMVHTVFYGQNEVYAVLRKGAKHFDYISEKSKIDNGHGLVFTIVEEMPEYPGGLDLFYKYLAEEIRYPDVARKNGIEGSVYVQFVVDKDGSILDVESIKGIGYGCDEEAVRVVQNAGKFNPGSQRGIPVRVRMVQPVKFKLNSESINPDNTTQGTITIDKLNINKDKLKVNANYNNGEWTGTVFTDAGDRLPGVNIVVAGGTLGTVSDLDGKFYLKTNESNDINLSFVGYESVKLEGK